MLLSEDHPLHNFFNFIQWVLFFVYIYRIRWKERRIKVKFFTGNDILIPTTRFGNGSFEWFSLTWNSNLRDLCVCQLLTFLWPTDSRERIRNSPSCSVEHGTDGVNWPSEHPLFRLTYFVSVLLRLPSINCYYSAIFSQELYYWMYRFLSRVHSFFNPPISPYSCPVQVTPYTLGTVEVSVIRLDDFRQ